jgi:3-hydroxyacyl-CoA dehydrogenase / enoyl-CoA hydratase / 3-hydroxybutyryl-CoA epimerase
MPFVEVIRGAKTNEQTVARALDYMSAVRKTIIMVNDGIGFYTSRVIAAYTGEALTLLAEGVDPATIDKAAIDAGMPLGPLAMADITSLTLLKDIFASIEGDGTRPGMRGMRAREALARMVDIFGRSGRAGGGGIFNYVEGRPELWSRIHECFPPLETPLDAETIERRLMYAQSLEAARALEDGVVASSADADLGSVLGWAFPSYTGGVASYIDHVGAKKFVREADELATRFGERFKAPSSLRAAADANAKFASF